MEFDELLKALTLLTAFIGLYLTALKIRRDQILSSRKALLDDFAVLARLNKDDFYYENVRTTIQRALLRMHPPRAVRDKAIGYGGLLLSLVAAPASVFLLIYDRNYLAWVCMFLTIVGLELHRRSLLPHGEVPSIDIK